LAAVTVGLVAVVLVFATPVPWPIHLPADWIAGLALVIAMQMSGCVQSILQSVAECEARLKIFAESSRCIQVRGFICWNLSIVMLFRWADVTGRIVASISERAMFKDDTLK
jgi:hypothetical protein